MRAATLFAALLSGTIFGFGLALATMIRPEVVLDFLRFRDLGLLLVLGGAVMVTLMTYQLAPRLLTKPLLGPAFEKHHAELSGRTLLGAALFGIGWGLCGVCPGPAIAGLGAGNWPLLLAVFGIFAGAYLQGRFFPGK
ncbi:MAG: YeeE/YedE family protein [Methylotetracoccus sp.]|jgi:hypothetical protein|nr:YeeE/YedE family protein [Methylotetracoccus sp.]